MVRGVNEAKDAGTLLAVKWDGPGAASPVGELQGCGSARPDFECRRGQVSTVGHSAKAEVLGLSSGEEGTPLDFLAAPKPARIATHEESL